jgi:hypothetical protein
MNRGDALDRLDSFELSLDAVIAGRYETEGSTEEGVRPTQSPLRSFAQPSSGTTRAPLWVDYTRNVWGSSLVYLGQECSGKGGCQTVAKMTIEWVLDPNYYTYRVQARGMVNFGVNEFSVVDFAIYCRQSENDGGSPAGIGQNCGYASPDVTSVDGGTYKTAWGHGAADPEGDFKRYYADGTVQWRGYNTLWHDLSPYVFCFNHGGGFFRCDF